MKTHYAVHCSLCKREMDRETIDANAFAYSSIVKEIKKEHPQWQQTTGICPMCLDYYEKFYLTARAA